MEPAAAKQQIVERIKQASNILVTVSNNPSVDQLAACIGTTLLLNKMDKHATAVFSGQVPSTIEFLQPEKTIETNTDSLQDFIISLDKNKADKLRYKVENDVVRIFITPYRTAITEKDLVFSQGDFNVEVVLALGVKDRNQLDKAITAHGRILHDATVISINAGNDKAAELGQINWQEPTASSLCEMIVSISEAFGTGLIDNQMATAFLTGIVAETKRFSNARTSPKVMTMSAQLMAAGANQQLIVSKLEPVSTPPLPPKPPPPKPPDSDKPVAKKIPNPPEKPPSGVLNVTHQPEKANSPEVKIQPGEIHIDEQGNIITSSLPKSPIPPIPSFQPPPPPPPPPLPQNLPPPDPAFLEPPKLPNIVKSSADPVHEPQVIAPIPTKPSGDDTPLPGPHSLLDPSAHQPALDTPFSASTKPDWFDPSNKIPTDPLSSAPRPNEALLGNEKVVGPPEAEVLPAAANASHIGVNNARNAVQSAYDAAPFNPAGHPAVALNAQPMAEPLHQDPPPPVPPPMMPTPNSNKR